MHSLQSVGRGSMKLASAVSCCVKGLEWEEIESPEGPALLSLQPSAPNGQVVTDCVNAQTASGILCSITEQFHRASSNFLYAFASCQSLLSTNRSAFTAKPVYLLLTESMLVTETHSCRCLHHPHSSCHCQCLQQAQA